METVHILFLRNRSDDLVLADMFRKRKLYQNTINAVVGIQFLYESEKFRLRYGIRLAYGSILYAYYL